MEAAQHQHDSALGHEHEPAHELALPLHPGRHLAVREDGEGVREDEYGIGEDCELAVSVFDVEVHGLADGMQRQTDELTD